jgi:hypothetical protein
LACLRWEGLSVGYGAAYTWISRWVYGFSDGSPPMGVRNVGFCQEFCR